MFLDTLKVCPKVDKSFEKLEYSDCTFYYMSYNIIGLTHTRKMFLNMTTLAEPYILIEKAPNKTDYLFSLPGCDQSQSPPLTETDC